MNFPFVIVLVRDELGDEIEGGFECGGVGIVNIGGRVFKKIFRPLDVETTSEECGEIVTIGTLEVVFGGVG
jgi:hypothetical protein